MTAHSAFRHHYEVVLGESSSVSKNSDTLKGRIHCRMNLSRNGGRPLSSHFSSLDSRIIRICIRFFSRGSDLLYRFRVSVPHWLLVLWRSLCWIVYVVLLWTFFSILLALLAIETVPLGPNFESIVGLALAGALVLALTLSRLQVNHKSAKKMSQRATRRWTIALIPIRCDYAVNHMP